MKPDADAWAPSYRILAVRGNPTPRDRWPTYGSTLSPASTTPPVRPGNQPRVEPVSLTTAHMLYRIYQNPVTPLITFAPTCPDPTFDTPDFHALKHAKRRQLHAQSSRQITCHAGRDHPARLGGSSPYRPRLRADCRRQPAGGPFRTNQGALGFTPVPITGQTFAVLVVGALLGGWRGGLALALYAIEGAFLPFFANAASGWFWTFTSGGYIVGFIPAAALVGWLCQLGWVRRPWILVAMLLGNAILYVPGTHPAELLPARRLCRRLGVRRPVAMRSAAVHSRRPGQADCRQPGGPRGMGCPRSFRHQPQH